MSGQELVLIHRELPGITQVILNRPEKRNALTIALLKQLKKALVDTTNLPDQRVLVLRGAGSVFCTGMDLTETADVSKAEEASQELLHTFQTLYESSLVTIATVQGAAIAGGAGLAAACDFILAESGTKFSFPEVRRGIVPAFVAALLRRQIAEHHVRELLLLGEAVDAEKALNMNLVYKVVSPGNLENEAVSLANLVNKGAPRALAETKRLLHLLYPASLNDDLQLALDFHKRGRTSDESQEGIQAFLEKRPPSWERK